MKMLLLSSKHRTSRPPPLSLRPPEARRKPTPVRLLVLVPSSSKLSSGTLTVSLVEMLTRACLCQQVGSQASLNPSRSASH